MMTKRTGQRCGDGRPAIQNDLYQFPYHYLPQLEPGGTPRLHRHLAWGLDYLTYLSFVVERIGDMAPQSLLDIGCGDGRLISLVKQLVPHVSGVDLSRQAVAFARAFNPGVEFRSTDIARVPGTYECVTVIEVLEHVSDEHLPEFVDNAARLVQPGGRVLVSVPTLNVPVNKKHYRHYDADLLNATLEPYFEIEKRWWLYRRGLLEHWLRVMMVNRFYVLNWSALLALIWRIHIRKTYFADASTGAHLACLAKSTRGHR